LVVSLKKEDVSKIDAVAGFKGKFHSIILVELDRESLSANVLF